MRCPPYGPYEGECYDGPHEGRLYKQEDPYFRVAFYELPVVMWRPTDYMSDEISARYGIYRWSSPLRKWVFQAP